MKRPMVFVVDLLSSLLILFVILTLISIPKAKTSEIETLGYYAVEITWPKGSDADIDLYVQSPSGNTTFYASSDSDAVYLEHDDLGLPDALNYERILLRSVEDGEYIVNVHAYDMKGEGPQEVAVTLWRLRGSDKELRSEKVVLERTGAEQTAFRFTPPNKFNELQARLVG